MVIAHLHVISALNLLGLNALKFKFYKTKRVSHTVITWACAVVMWVLMLPPTLAATVNKAASDHMQCPSKHVACAKTVTTAFAPTGDLWRLWVHDNAMYYQVLPSNLVDKKHSNDVSEIKNADSFSEIKKVNIPTEKISARNENRPKIAFDHQQGVYLSWASPREKRFTADVRFSYSLDNGNTFSTPITVNNDNLLTGHSFNEMHVSPTGDISIVWLDGRLKYQLKKAGKKANGSALFLAQANVRKTPHTEFTNVQLANNTCVCCRIAIDVNKQNELAVFWRHIYGDNIREFALLTLKDDQPLSTAEVIQISHDYWQIDGCPHQGGGISIDDNNQYHLVWFNQGQKGKGIFYASSSDEGKTLTTPLQVGQLTAQASHPHLLESHNVVDIVWTQYDGENHSLWHQRSVDNGKTFSTATKLNTSPTQADRPFIVKYNNQHYVSWQKPQIEHWFKAL